MAQAVYQLDSSGQVPQGQLRYPPAGPQEFIPIREPSLVPTGETIDDDDPYRMNNAFYTQLKAQLSATYPLRVDKDVPREAAKEPEALDDKIKRAAEEVKETFKGQDNAQRKRDAVDKVAQRYLENHPDKSKIDISDFKEQLISATSISPSRAASPSAFATIKST
jgi:hypothetical protein